MMRLCYTFAVVGPRRPLSAPFFLLIGLVGATFAYASSPRPLYIPYNEAEPILEALAEALPPELKNENPSQVAARWSEWVVHRDAAIRARLARGGEDSLVNLLLFGASFTSQPRITPEELRRLEAESQSAPASTAGNEGKFSQLLQSRMSDLVRALANPGSNERLLFARRVVENTGHSFANPAEREKVKKYMSASLIRVLQEQNSYAEALNAARLLGDTTEEFAERSKLYRSRGLSLDTSLRPNFAVEQSLKAMQTRGLLARGSVLRVGIIGPGLDFVDKQSGYDFYPQQTIQPFGVIDTLLRLGLARSEALEVTTFDISPRVNDHLARARERAQHRIGYTVQLPREVGREWNPEFVHYWERFGDQIGASVPPAKVPPTADKLAIRAVSIRPSIVARVTPADVNIVLQRLEVPAGSEGFDLIIGTNVFVYYDVFEQSLALANVQHMLRPGGFLLSNNALLELPSAKIRSVDYLTTVYSDAPDDGDHIVWYQRLKH